MLQRLSIDGIQLPRLYIAENRKDVEIAKQSGIPYIRWQNGQKELIKQLLRPTIEKMFPGIDWTAVLGWPNKKVMSKIVEVPGCTRQISEENITDVDSEAMLEAQYKYDEIVDDLNHNNQLPNKDGEYCREVGIADSQRDIVNDYSELSYDSFTIDRLPISDYIGDLSSSVDIEALQKLGMLPAFLGDITDCIKHNLSQSMRWTEGYNKKLGYPLGRFNCKAELPNLLIIDISASIPDGIAATMLTLADTLRSQCNAELIITSERSGYYPEGAELPKPQTLRDYYGRGNEAAEFYGILKSYIAGREFGHVISFGDNDSPGWFAALPNLINTKVHAVHHYHTRDKYKETGYARWVKCCCPDAEQHFDTSWCRIMNRSYRM